MSHPKSILFGRSVFPLFFSFHINILSETFYTHSWSTHNDRSTHFYSKLLWFCSTLFTKTFTLTVVHRLWCVWLYTYWAAIKLYKAMRLFEKVFLNSVWSFVLLWLLLLLFEFVVVVVFSFHLFYSSIFHLIFCHDNMRASRQANTPTHSYDNKQKEAHTHTYIGSIKIHGERERKEDIIKLIVMVFCVQHRIISISFVCGRTVLFSCHSLSMCRDTFDGKSSTSTQTHSNIFTWIIYCCTVFMCSKRSLFNHFTCTTTTIDLIWLMTNGKNVKNFNFQRMRFGKS